MFGRAAFWQLLKTMDKFDRVGEFAGVADFSAVCVGASAGVAVFFSRPQIFPPFRVEASAGVAGFFAPADFFSSDLNKLKSKNHLDILNKNS